jgi:uncharacterized Zn finger protein (UPF0148 family)
MKYTCSACGHLVFAQLPGSDDICPICGWQDDALQLKFPLECGANRISLFDAQRNFSKFGAIEERKIDSVRKPTEDEPRNEKWRVLDVKKDRLEEPPGNQNYLQAYPEGSARLYYWEK